MSNSGNPDVWFITGCSTGLGAALAKYAYSAGSFVVATARNPATLSYLPDDSRLLKLALDVTSIQSIADAFKAAVDKFGHVDVVVNNAGYGLMNDTEAISDAEARAQLDTNFWGAVDVTKAALPIFRERKPPGQGGLVIQITSMGGRITVGGSSYYHASKFALEGFTESLSKEVSPAWNIKFLIIEPGGIKTNFAPGRPRGQRHPAYLDPSCPFNQLLAYMEDEKNYESWADAEVCARVIHEAASSRNTRNLPLRLLLGSDAVSFVHHGCQNALKEIDDWRALSESCSGQDQVDSVQFLKASA